MELLFTGIFGDKGRSNSQKHSSQAGGSQAEDGIPQHGSTVPAAPTSPSPARLIDTHAEIDHIPAL